MSKMNSGCRWTMDDEVFLRRGHPMRFLIFVSQLHKKTIERMLNSTGLHRAQHRLLMTLSENKFNSQAELAKGLEVSTATVAVSLKKLERDGFIQKKALKDDSRANFVMLTKKGKNVVEESQRIFECIEQQSTKDFSEKELSDMRKYLKRIYDNLAEM